jgi:acylphosphatase
MITGYRVMVQVHMFADGRVQGVNFRYNTRRYASSLGLKGWVRNLRDGRVEILAQGLQDDIQKLIKYIKGSPGLSQVAKLDIDWEEPLTRLSGFDVKF